MSAARTIGMAAASIACERTRGCERSLAVVARPVRPRAVPAARGAAVDRLGQPQPRRGPAVVQVDDVARIDQVRIADLLAVELPDLGPAPGFFEELAGDAPQGVAADHDVFVGRIAARSRAGRCRLRERRGLPAGAGASEEVCD
jgi:hypothetical protein